MPQSNSAQHRHRRGAQRVLAVTASLAIATSIVLAGAGSSFALWNSSVVVSAGSLSSGTVAITQHGFDGMATDYSPANLSVTSPVTVANTGSASFDFSASFRLSADSSPALASAISVTVWEIDSVAECAATSVPVGARTGTWSTTPAFFGQLAPGTAQLFCFRSILDSAALTSHPGAFVAPELTVSATIGGWRAVATASAMQTTPDRQGIGCTQLGSVTTLDWLDPQSSNYGLYVNGLELAKNKKASSPYEVTIDELAAAGVISPGVVKVEVRQLGQGAVLFTRTLTVVSVGTQLELRC